MTLEKAGVVEVECARPQTDKAELGAAGKLVVRQAAEQSVIQSVLPWVPDGRSMEGFLVPLRRALPFLFRDFCPKWEPRQRNTRRLVKSSRCLMAFSVWLVKL